MQYEFCSRKLPPTPPFDPVPEVYVGSAAVGEGGLNWKVSVAKNPVVCGRLGVLVEGPEVDGFAGDVGHSVVLVSGAGAASARKPRSQANSEVGMQPSKKRLKRFKRKHPLQKFVPGVAWA